MYEKRSQPSKNSQNNNQPSQKQRNLQRNKRHLSADGSSLLPSALRPRLFLSLMGATFAAFFQMGMSAAASATSLKLEVPTNGVTISSVQPATGGTFKESDAGEIKVTTDGSFGYTLNIRAKDGNTLKNGTNTLTSISSALTNEQYGAAGNENTWGYKPSKLASSNNTSFQPGPTDSVLLDKTSTSATEAQTYTVSIGAKVGAGAVAGTYTNTFVFSLTANTASYNVKYNLNGGNGGPSTNPQTGTTTDSSITIGAPEPTKSGSTFKGWCDRETTGASCGGTTYTAGQEYTLHEGENNLELWAMWEAAMSSELLTQQFTASTSSLTFKVGAGIDMVMIADGSASWKPYYAFPGKDVTFSSTSGKKYLFTIVPSAGQVLGNIDRASNGTYTFTGVSGSYPSMQDFSQCTAAGTNVTDTRNNVSYTVALIGSRCWMLSNLRLAAGTVLNSSTSNVSSSFTLPTASWTDSNTSPVMKECHDTAGNDSSNTTCNNTATGITEYYYNWVTAKANTSGVTSGGYSICPKNWTLPNYSDDITTTNAWSSGNNPGMMATVGSFLSSTQRNVGSNARWWSSAQYNSSRGYYLGFEGSVANRGDSSKSLGYSVRCMR